MWQPTKKMPYREDGKAGAKEEERQVLKETVEKVGIGD